MLMILFILALAVLFLLILKFKLEPFIALLITSFGLALAVQIPIAEASSIIAEGFGNTLAGVGILIGLGIVFGQFLAKSGAVEKIAEGILSITGVKKSPAGLALTGSIVSIPVFFDAAFVILNKVIKSLTKKTGIAKITFVTALAVGLIVSHSMVIPTPGPLVVAENIGVDLGIFLMMGIFVAVIATLVGGYGYGMFIGKRIKTEEIEDEMEEVQEETDERPNGKEITKSLSFGLIALPIVLILSNTVAQLFIPENPLAAFFAFVGDKNVALLIAVLVSLLVLKPYIAGEYKVQFNKSMQDAGSILLITGAGGAFGAVINASGMGDYLIEMMTSWNIHILLLAFIFTQILRASLGSATVALVTTSSILGPQVAELAVSPVLLALAICSGAIGLSLPNDSGFWVVNRFGNLTVPQTLKAWSLGGFVAGLTGITLVYIMHFITIL
ncbi:GntP family permease [Salinicoccus roseus]|uniref:GntP family permease n=1 Tax=Salinicoccus roseus TaxID=45670 RepID=UPI000F4DA1A4|nr:GntP family permease [Salinicoccus roseus]RPE52924.1 GntP family gluconate:H+ symporter [Salinicoccus roseus]GGA72224.1 gluconate permease [Salinicoccus roseus]